jgi:hypothetical protein
MTLSTAGSTSFSSSTESGRSSRRTGHDSRRLSGFGASAGREDQLLQALRAHRGAPEATTTLGASALGSTAAFEDTGRWERSLIETQ